MSKSKDFILLLEKQYDPLTFKDGFDIKNLSTWIDTLSFEFGRISSKTKKVVADLKLIKGSIEAYIKWNGNEIFIGNIKATISRWTKADIILINSTLVKKSGESDTIKERGNTYINKSKLSFKVFKIKVNIISKFLSSVKGFHKKSLKGGLTFWFVSRDKMKTAAKYESEADIIWIRPDRVKANTGYGSFLYVIMHELGHRYERLINQRIDFSGVNWITTKYSKVDVMSGGEQFAELFALSYWKKDYTEYIDTITKFLTQMKENKMSKASEIIKMLNETVTEIILKQLGGRKFIAMTGAKNLAKSDNDKTLSFKIGKNKGKITHVSITLNNKDLYDITFFRIKGASIKKDIIKDVVVDNLRSIFTDKTGLDTNL